MYLSVDLGKFPVNNVAITHLSVGKKKDLQVLIYHPSSPFGRESK